MTDEKRQTLAQIVESKRSALALIDAAEGELSGEVEAFLVKIGSDLTSKVDGYVTVDRELESQGDYYKEMAQAFQAKAKQIQMIRDGMKARIKMAMQVLNVTELQGEIHTYKLTSTRAKLVVDETDLPAEYKQFVYPEPYWEPNREAIEVDLKAGKEIPGAELHPVHALRVSLAKKGK